MTPRIRNRVSGSSTAARAVCICVAVLLCCGCYEKKITHSYDCSQADDNDAGTKIVFARWHRAFRRPVGISRFPDGGRPKYLQDELALVVHDLAGHASRLLVEARGVPRSSLDVSVSWQKDLVVYRVNNVREEDDLENHIHVVDVATGRQKELDSYGLRPRLSPDAGRIAYLQDGKLWTMDPDGENAQVIHDPPPDVELVFVVWEDREHMQLHVRADGQFQVLTLDLQTGQVSESDLPYAKNYGLRWVDEGVCRTPLS